MLNFFKPKPKKEKSLGQRGEEFAQEEYRKRGYKIIASNFFNKRGLRKGEIDFIARDSKSIIFVEVKTRKAFSEKFGSGAEAVNRFKQDKLLKAVKIFLLENREYQTLRPQIDVCSVRYAELDSPVFSATIVANAVEDFS